MKKTYIKPTTKTICPTGKRLDKCSAHLAESMKRHGV